MEKVLRDPDASEEDKAQAKQSIKEIEQLQKKVAKLAKKDPEGSKDKLDKATYDSEYDKELAIKQWEKTTGEKFKSDDDAGSDEILTQIRQAQRILRKRVMKKNPRVMRKNPRVMRKNPRVMRKNPRVMRKNPRTIRIDPTQRILRKMINPRVMKKNPRVMRKNPRTIRIDPTQRILRKMIKPTNR